MSELPLGKAVTYDSAYDRALLFRLLVGLALRVGLNPIDLKLMTAVFVLVALALPRLRRSGRRQGGKAERSVAA